MKKANGKYTTGDFCCAAWFQINTKDGKDRAAAVVRCSLIPPFEAKTAADERGEAKSKKAA